MAKNVFFENIKFLKESGIVLSIIDRYVPTYSDEHHYIALVNGNLIIKDNKTTVEKEVNLYNELLVSTDIE